MKKTMMVTAAVIFGLMLSGCAAGKSAPAASSEPEVAESTEPATTEETKSTENEAEESVEPAETEVAESTESETTETRLTDDEAVSAIRNYCIKNNPDLEDIEKDGEYPTYWEVESSDENEIVVLYRSYTGALVRYYIDPVSGEAYVTEFVQGITEEEERTDETLNVRDYLD